MKWSVEPISQAARPPVVIREDIPLAPADNKYHNPVKPSPPSDSGSEVFIFFLACWSEHSGAGGQVQLG